MTPANIVFRRELRLPCDLLFGAPPDKEVYTTDYAANISERLHDIHLFARQHLKGPVSGWRHVMTAWPALLDSKRVTKFGYTAQPGREGSHLSCRHVRKGRTTPSHGSTSWSTISSGIPGQRCWWSTWIDWRQTWGLLGTIILEEGAV
jgi:hypothetical protein